MVKPQKPHTPTKTTEATEATKATKATKPGWKTRKPKKNALLFKWVKPVLSIFVSFPMSHFNAPLHGIFHSAMFVCPMPQGNASSTLHPCTLLYGQRAMSHNPGTLQFASQWLVQLDVHQNFGIYLAHTKKDRQELSVQCIYIYIEQCSLQMHICIHIDMVFIYIYISVCV